MCSSWAKRKVIRFYVLFSRLPFNQFEHAFFVILSTVIRLIFFRLKSTFLYLVTLFFTYIQLGRKSAQGHACGLGPILDFDCIRAWSSRGPTPPSLGLKGGPFWYCIVLYIHTAWASKYAQKAHFRFEYQKKLCNLTVNKNQTKEREFRIKFRDGGVCTDVFRKI